MPWISEHESPFLLAGFQSSMHRAGDERHGLASEDAGASRALLAPPSQQPGGRRLAGACDDNTLSHTGAEHKKQRQILPHSPVLHGVCLKSPHRHRHHHHIPHHQCSLPLYHRHRTFSSPIPLSEIDEFSIWILQDSHNHVWRILPANLLYLNGQPFHVDALHLVDRNEFPEGQR